MTEDTLYNFNVCRMKQERETFRDPYHISAHISSRTEGMQRAENDLQASRLSQRVRPGTGNGPRVLLSHPQALVDLDNF